MENLHGYINSINHDIRQLKKYFDIKSNHHVPIFHLKISRHMAHCCFLRRSTDQLRRMERLLDICVYSHVLWMSCQIYPLLDPSIPTISNNGSVSNSDLIWYQFVYILATHHRPCWLPKMFRIFYMPLLLRFHAANFCSKLIKNNRFWNELKYFL